MSRCDPVARFASLAPLFEREGPFAPANFESVPAADTLELLAEKRVLVIGAGGLGCETLKDLALSGFTQIEVVDMDTVDVSNLNRQFLFRKTDVGKFKSQVAAEFVMRRCRGVQVIAHTSRIQSFARPWFRRFDLVVACLDNEEARHWINEVLVDLVRYDPSGRPDMDTVIPLVDGGTEGWSGQARLMLPGVSYCMECSSKSAAGADATHFHLCTIANVPRTPEHCVMWAQLIHWPRLRSLSSAAVFDLATGEGEEPHGVELDKDSEEHMTWLWQRASERAIQYGIEPPSYSLTMQVVKNIIPAIASTNALISATGVAEALKFLTCTAPLMNRYFLYTADNFTTGVNCQTYPYKRQTDCPACHPRHVFRLHPVVEPFGAVLTELEERMGFEHVSIHDHSETNPVLALTHQANNVADQAQRTQPASRVLKEGHVYKAMGPGRKPLKFVVQWDASKVLDEGSLPVSTDASPSPST